MPKRIGTALFMAVLAFSGVAHAAQSKEPVTPQQVQAMCRERSAVQVVQWLAAKGGALWQHAMKQVAAGNEEWLLVVPCLTFGADAGNATDITVALATALPVNPAGVLRLEASHVSLKMACSFPFIEPEPEFTARYAAQTVLALQAIVDTALQDDANICVQRLQRVLGKAQQEHTSEGSR